MDFPILKLPNELIGYIINMLPQHQALELRLVSRKVKNYVDAQYDFIVQMDNSNPLLGWLLDRRVRECTVVPHLLECDYNMAFKYPSIVRTFKTLAFSSLQEFKPANVKLIWPDTFQRLLVSCHKYLYTLRISIPESMIMDDTLNRVVYDFDNLSTFELITNFRAKDNDDRLFYKIVSRDNIFHGLLVDSKTPNLQEIIVKLGYNSIEGIKSMWSSVMMAISKSRLKTIQTLEINQMGFYMNSTGPLAMDDVKQIIDIEGFHKIKTIRNIKFYQVPNNKKSCWNALLSQQSELKRLDTLFVVDGMSHTVFDKVILTNLCSLVSVKVQFSVPVASNDENKLILNFEMFANCVNLVELKLTSHVHRDNCGVPKIINLSMLPIRLEVLELENLEITTSGLLNYCTEARRALRQVSIKECDSTGRNGNTGSVLEKYTTTLPSIIKLNLVCFNVSVPSEVAKLKKMCTRYNIAIDDEDDDEFMEAQQVLLMRKDVDTPWHSVVD